MRYVHVYTRYMYVVAAWYEHIYLWHIMVIPQCWVYDVALVSISFLICNIIRLIHPHHCAFYFTFVMSIAQSSMEHHGVAAREVLQPSVGSLSMQSSQNCRCIAPA